MKHLLKFLVVAGIAVLLGIGIFNAYGIKQLLKNTFISENIMEEPTYKNITDPHLNEKPKPGNPNGKYKVKYRLFCKNGLNGTFYYTTPHEFLGRMVRGTEIEEFLKNTYPPKDQKIFEHEFYVDPPFKIKLSYLANTRDKTMILIFINDELVEKHKAIIRTSNELIWKIVE